MNNLYYSIFVVALTALAINYDPVRADTAEASASASASATAGAEAPLTNDYDPDEHSVSMAGPEDNFLTESLVMFNQGLKNEIEAHPYLYDRADVENLLLDSNAVYATQFLNQRSGDWRRAYQLALQTLKWRADMGISHLKAQMFPCDLFSLGLIFEQGQTHQRDETGAYTPGNPVIWIRLGALGSVIKQMEKLTGKRVASFVFSTVHSVASNTRKFADRLLHRNRPQVPVLTQQGVPPGPRKHEDLSVKNERTIAHVLKSIAWWLEDWQKNHEPGSQATLVLDFEGTDFALSSTSTSDFFIKLDDRFPDLFDQIIGFRYKLNVRSVHGPIGFLNKVFTSRVKSSPETDRKLKFVNREADISAYLPRVDVWGHSMLPDYISGKKSLCIGATHTPPAGCQAELDGSNSLYDPQLWQAIHNEFYQVCKPQKRV